MRDFDNPEDNGEEEANKDIYFKGRDGNEGFEDGNDEFDDWRHGGKFLISNY